MKKVFFFTLFVLLLTCAVMAQEQEDVVARAEESRQKTGDFEGSSYFPSEWEAADSLYRAKDYEPAAEAFEAIFKRTIPLYAQAREDEIMEIRRHLISIGARDIILEYFRYADETALAALDQYEAENYYPARDTAAQAFMMYRVLASACNAWLLRQEIQGRDFEDYDRENYERAGDILNRAMDRYETGDNDSAMEDAEEAYNRYKLVLATAWAAYAESRFSMAKSERDTAVEIKAPIATRDNFAEADSLFRTAVEKYEAENYEEAAMYFIDAEALFRIISTSATEKRKIAADTIQEAQIKLEESNEIVKQAEIVLKGGAR